MCSSGLCLLTSGDLYNIPVARTDDSLLKDRQVNAEALAEGKGKGLGKHLHEPSGNVMSHERAA